MLRITRTLKLMRQAQVGNQTERNAFASKDIQERNLAVQNWYGTGGALFLDWTKKNYRMHNGEPLEWHEPFLESLFLAIGNPWIEKLIIQKPAQVGYTESLIAFTSFVLAYLRSPIGLGFETQKKLHQMAGKRIQRAFDYCEPIQNLANHHKKLLRREDINSKESITVGGVPLELFYAKAQESKEDEQAPSGMRSFTARVVCVDEFGLCDYGILDVAEARMAKSDWATKKTIAGSTPSIEGGIVDTEFRKAKYRFEWQVECPHCKYLQFLDAFGNFLRCVVVEEDGIKEERYVDQVGKPLDWFHRGGEDEELAKTTAYIGCQECGEELTKLSLDSGEFICINTGISWTELNFMSIAEQLPITGSVGMNLPKLASTSFKAVERLNFMFRTKRPADGIQQFLGRATSLGTGKIKLGRLKAAQEAVSPQREHDLILLGVDQGRYGNWFVLAKWWFGEDTDKEIRWRDGFKEVIEWGQIPRIEGIEEFAASRNVDCIGLDQEPEFNAAVDYGLKHLPQKRKKEDGRRKEEESGIPSSSFPQTSSPFLQTSSFVQKKGQVYLFDQMMLEGEHFRRTLRKVQSVKAPNRASKEVNVPIYIIDRTYFLDAVRDRLYRGLQKFPATINYDPKDNNNIFHHYLTSDRLPNGTWVEPQNSPDHMLHCDSFIEALVKASLYEPGVSNFAFGRLEDSANSGKEI
jgi:hypothetical protein